MKIYCFHFPICKIKVDTGRDHPKVIFSLNLINSMNQTEAMSYFNLHRNKNKLLHNWS